MTKQKGSGVGSGAYGFGTGRPIGAGRAEILPSGVQPMSNVHADVPPGVHQDTMHQAVAPFAGTHALPTGQTISVNMNAPNPNLTLKEWIVRGALGGVGRVFAWPFRLVGMVFEGIAHGVIKVVTWAMIIILVPTMLMLGGRLEKHMEQQKSIQSGAAEIMHDGRQAVHGLRAGATDNMTAQPTAQDAADADTDTDTDAPNPKQHHRRHHAE